MIYDRHDFISGNIGAVTRYADSGSVPPAEAIMVKSHEAGGGKDGIGLLWREELVGIIPMSSSSVRVTFDNGNLEDSVVVKAGSKCTEFAAPPGYIIKPVMIDPHGSIKLRLYPYRYDITKSIRYY